MANSNEKKTAARAADSAPKKAKKKKRTRRKHPVIFTIFLIIFSIFVSALLTIVIVGSTMFSYITEYVNGKKVIDLDFYKSSQSQTSIMYGTKASGKIVELTRLHGEENRIWVDYDEFPDDLIWAFVCLEDKRFFDHEGVDWIRTVGVMINPNYSGQGASTITQQLIKNLTKQNEVTYIRKFNEILRALNLEKNYSKKDILEAYLNTIYLGNGCYGVKTASEKYFGKEVKNLSLVECATLAAIVKAPYTKNPIYNYDACMEYGYEYNEASRMIYYGGLKIYAAVDLDMQSQLEKIYLNRSGFPYSRTDKNGKLPQSAMTIMDYQGRIVALVGGTGEKTVNRVYNRATDRRAKRQPGSSIKPLAVYAPAVDLGLITPTSPILEKAITIGGRQWPRNFNGDHGSGNYISVQEALVRSLNTVPVRILSEMLGTNSSMEYCNDHFHLNLSSTDKDLSPLAVGGTNTGVTTLEMAAAFATFGNGGKYYKPYSYYKVVDRNGEVLLQNKDPEPERALKLATANTMLGMLTKAVTQSNGTGYGSKISNVQTFAKTGTTSDNCDKWYCGGTPHYVTAVWYGYDYRADLHTGSTNPAKTIFKYVFTQLTGSLPSKTFADVIVECGGSKEDAAEVVSSKAFTAAATTAATTKEDDADDEEDETTTKATTAATTAESSMTAATTAAPTTAAPTTTAPPTTAAPTTTAPPATTAAPAPVIEADDAA